MMAGNWKMNNTDGRGRGARAGRSRTSSDKEWPKRVDVVVCPPYIGPQAGQDRARLRPSAKSTSARRTCTGSRRAPSRARYRFPCSRSVDCTCSIVGHSERRELLRRDQRGQSTARSSALLAWRPVCRSMRAASRCAVRDEGGTEEFVCAQVRAAFAGLERRGGRQVRGGLRAHLGHRHGPHGHARAGAGRMRRHPRRRSPTCSAPRRADEMRILYGGSMNVGNVEQLLAAARYRRRPGRRRQPEGRPTFVQTGAKRACNERRRRNVLRTKLSLPACLIIMDGLGLAPAGPGNAVSLASTPVLDQLFETCSHTKLEGLGRGRGPS